MLLLFVLEQNRHIVVRFLFTNETGTLWLLHAQERNRHVFAILFQNKAGTFSLFCFRTKQARFHYLVSEQSRHVFAFFRNKAGTFLLFCFRTKQARFCYCMFWNETGTLLLFYVLEQIRHVDVITLVTVHHACGHIARAATKVFHSCPLWTSFWVVPQVSFSVFRTRSASRAAHQQFDSRFLRGDFSGSGRTSGLIGTPVATLPGAWRYRVSAETGWPCISIL